MKKQLFCIAFLSLLLPACGGSDYVPVDAYLQDQSNAKNVQDNTNDQITALESQIMMANQTIKELNNKLEMQEETLAILQVEANAQAEAMAKQEQAMKEQAKAQPKASSSKSSASNMPAPSISKITSGQLTEKQAYEEALRFYQTGRFPQAHNAFNAFRESYPTTQYAPNAIYWSGEAFYAQEKYSQAIIQFKDLIARFPDNAKVADALLKTALSYQKLGDTTNASIHATVLNSDWPNSDAARKARQYNF